MRSDINAIPLEMKLDGIETRGLTWGDILVRHIDLPPGVDFTPLFKGLPDDRCQCPHWGYVTKGKMTYRYADREEVYAAGEAFYAPPGHVPVQHEPGTEIVMFSPAEELKQTEAIMAKNMQAMQPR